MTLTRLEPGAEPRVGDVISVFGGKYTVQSLDVDSATVTDGISNWEGIGIDEMKAMYRFRPVCRPEKPEVIWDYSSVGRSRVLVDGVMQLRQSDGSWVSQIGDCATLALAKAFATLHTENKELRSENKAQKAVLLECDGMVSREAVERALDRLVRTWSKAKFWSIVDGKPDA